jgi:hypothetical protein
MATPGFCELDVMPDFSGASKNSTPTRERAFSAPGEKNVDVSEEVCVGFCYNPALPSGV